MTVRGTQRKALLAGGLGLLAAGLPSAGAAESAAGAWRKTLRVEAGAGDAPVTAVTTVFLDERFSGFTVVDAQGRPRPAGLLSRHGGRFSFHFDARPGETLTLLPAARAEPPPAETAHVSGLRHLARAFDGREIASAAQFEALWRDAPPQGGAFAAHVYAAFNPFGPASNTLHRFDGFLRVARPGAHVFCTASTDASFLLVNGREVAAWPGRHPAKAGLDGSRRGTVELPPGTHRFTYLHANAGPEHVAIAAWVPPGEKAHTVIPADAFTPAAYAFVGPLAGGAQPQAELLWENRYMVTLRGHALYDLAFEAVLPQAEAGAACAWSFGDGTRAAGARVEHLYFTPGERRVTLAVTFRDGTTATSSHTVRVEPRYGQNENDDARTLALLARAVAQERERGIEPPGYALISHGFFFYLKEREAAAFAERVLAAADRLPPEDLHPVMNELALGLQQVDEQYALAERCFRVILDRVADPRARASAALHFGGMLNLCLNRPQEARDILAAIRREDLADWEPRLLDIYLADTAMVLDDVATARRRYLAIPKPTPVVDGATLNRQALFDYNSRFFRLQNLLSQQLYRESLTELDLLEWEIPEERLSPRMNLLKVQALVGNGQPRKAVVCLQRALLAEVDDTYTPALRLELARLYVSLNQLAQAKHQLDLIRKESPWTQEELGARNLLQTIERKLGEVTP